MNIYIVKKFAKKVDANFFSKVKIFYYKNPVCLGWIFELFFLQNIYTSHRNNVPCQMYDSNGNVTELPVHAIREDTEDVNLSINDIEDGTMYIPTCWNQGCFDAVYYETSKIRSECHRKFVFFNATIARTHCYNFNS